MRLVGFLQLPDFIFGELHIQRSERIPTLAFVADPHHKQYAGYLSEQQVIDTIATCCGQRGPNAVYLANTVQHLDALGIADGPLHKLLQEVKKRCPDI